MVVRAGGFCVKGVWGSDHVMACHDSYSSSSTTIIAAVAHLSPTVV